ncbi:MAG: zinc ribbon domain-containing protein [Bryobacterales bacterium]|nr:zinc ribbon domain-containing protein [Bryobacterales bacterium]
MADFCTCGAQLPVDARFCHRCGRPLFAEAPPEIEDSGAFVRPPGIQHSADDLRALAGPPPESLAHISFHNTRAVSAAFYTAILIWILMVIPLGGLAGFLLKMFVLLGGGSLAVIFYSRRTGQILSVAAGARLGWITGVLFYVIWMLFFTVTIVAVQEQGGLIELSRKQLKEANYPADSVQQMTEIMNSPEAFGVFIVIMLIVMFIMVTLPMILGGAAAAKAMGRD